MHSLKHPIEYSLNLVQNHIAPPQITSINMKKHSYLHNLTHGITWVWLVTHIAHMN